MMVDAFKPFVLFICVLGLLVLLTTVWGGSSNSLPFPVLSIEHITTSVEKDQLVASLDISFSPSDRRRYFGTHHKTGTILAALVQDVANGFLSGTPLVSGFFIRPENASVPVLTVGVESNHSIMSEKAVMDGIFCPCSSFVHFVRDPIDMVVSAFMYHRSGPAEPWLYETIDIGFSAQWLGNVSLSRIHEYIKSKPDYTPGTPLDYLSWYDILHLVPKEVGIRGEMEMQRVGVMPNMLEVVGMLNKAKQLDNHELFKYCLPVPATRDGETSCERAVEKHRYPSVMQVGLEEFNNYNSTMMKIFEFLDMVPPAPKGMARLRAHSASIAARTAMLDALTVYDVSRMSSESRAENGHITAGKDTDERAFLREVAMKLAQHTPWILEARHLLGYT